MCVCVSHGSKVIDDLSRRKQGRFGFSNSLSAFKMDFLFYLDFFSSSLKDIFISNEKEKELNFD